MVRHSISHGDCGLPRRGALRSGRAGVGAAVLPGLVWTGAAGFAGGVVSGFKVRPGFEVLLGGVFELYGMRLMMAT